MGRVVEPQVSTKPSVGDVLPGLRFADLASVAERLSAATSPDEVFDVVASRAAAVAGMSHADVAIVRDGMLVSSRQAWPFDAELTARYGQVRLDAHFPTAEAARRRRLVTVEDLETYQAAFPEVLRDIRAAGVVSMAALPFFDAKGDVLGVLGVVSTSRTTFDDERLGAIRILGELTGNALRRIQLIVRAGEMSVVAANLSRAATAVDVAAALRDFGHQPLGALLVNCRVVNRQAGTLDALVPGALPDELAARYETVRLADPSPLSAAVVGDEPVWIPEPDDFTARFPATAADAQLAGFSALAAIPLHDASGAVVGVLSFAWRNPVRFDGLIQATVLTVADLAAQSLERARLTDARLRTARRSEAVAALGQRVSTATTRAEGAALLAEHGARTVGAVDVAVGLFDRELGDLRVTTARASQDGDGLRALLHEAFHGSRHTVVEDGESCRVAIALRSGSTPPIGAVAFAWDAPHVVDDEELAFLRAIAAIGRRTLDRARILEERTSDARALAAFAGALATAVRGPEVAAAVAELGAPLLRARYASVAVVDASGSALEHLALRGLPDDLAEHFRFIPLDSDLPAAVAFRQGRTTTVASQAELLAHHPTLAEPSARTGVESTAHVIVRDAAERPVGLLSVGWDGPTEFDDVLLARLEAIGDLIGQTLERADLYDAEHQLVIAMQQRLLGSVPRPATVDLATRYLPAIGVVGIGGDWFDVVPTSDGFTLVVGDVTGHGVDAVTAMAQLRTLIAGLLRAGELIDAVFPKVEAMLDRSDLVLASAELFAVDTTSWQLRYCSAGHPWALIRRANGAVEVLDEGQRALIGAPVRPAGVGSTQLEPGDTLVAYTDGLVERRDEPITRGIDRLIDRLGSAAGDASVEEVADALLDAAGLGPAGDGRDDDVALVVLRRR